MLTHYFQQKSSSQTNLHSKINQCMWSHPCILHPAACLTLHPKSPPLPGMPYQRNALPRPILPLPLPCRHCPEKPCTGWICPAQKWLTGHPLQCNCVDASACINTVCLMALPWQCWAEATQLRWPKGTLGLHPEAVTTVQYLQTRQ